MATRRTAITTREIREMEAWDEDDGVMEKNRAWVQRVVHVLECPNTQRGERLWDELIAAAAPGATVLEVGCGDGACTLELLKHQPAQVIGIDISARMIETARTRVSDARVDFRAQSAMAPLAEQFDLIAGRAILHHIDYREFLSRVFRDNLRPGARMLFMEPMGHPFAVAFHRLVRSAHSPDERLLRRSDVAWLNREFPHVDLYGINLLSLPAAILSTFLFPSADNRLTRTTDRLDCRALELAPALATYARQAIIVIEKPRLLAE